MFLHTILYMVILQTTFLSMYTILKMTYAFTSTAPRTTTFTVVLSRDGPVSGFSLHVYECQPSALWVVGSGSSVMLVFLHVHEL
jgi:hypothetical protein